MVRKMTVSVGVLALAILVLFNALRRAGATLSGCD